MKQTLLIITFLLSGYLQNFAQNYETFVTEMKKLEQEEKEYSGILFRKNDYSAEYKKGFEPKLKKVREEKVTLARKAIEANSDDKRFVDVLNFYLFNYLSIEELDRMLDRFTADARQHPMWKSMKSYVTYKPLNAVGHKEGVQKVFGTLDLFVSLLETEIKYPILQGGILPFWTPSTTARKSPSPRC